MKGESVSTSSQTVGPFFRIGLEYLIDCAPPVAEEDAISIRGRVLDRNHAPVPDAMLEFWSPNVAKDESGPTVNEGYSSPRGFRRAATDLEGNFCIAISRPTPVPLDDGTAQAPHLLVLVFARGLLRHLISRVYLSDEPANASDPVLLRVPAERRRTLIAQLESKESSCFRWDVVLQGPEETVFFAW